MTADKMDFLKLCGARDLDDDTAYTICRMIDIVGYKVQANWNWNWLQGKNVDYRSLINFRLAKAAWSLLLRAEWVSLQTTDDEMRRISTISPLVGLINLQSLVLQNNLIADLQPVSSLSKLKYLNCHANRVTDISPLKHIRLLEEVKLGQNPLASLMALVELPNLRRLAISTDQLPLLSECGPLSSIQVLEIRGENPVNNLADFPEMPLLKVLRLDRLQDTTGMERFASLRTLEFSQGDFPWLDGANKLKGLTHLKIWTSRALSLEPLSALYALRCVEILAPAVDGLSALARLPVLHEVKMCDQTKYNKAELEVLNKSLTPWADEFRAPETKASPSLNIEIVNQEAFDFYNVKESFGITAGECEDGMFKSEREWLVGEIRSTLKTNFKEDGDGDFLLPGTTGFRRSDRLVLYSRHAYESFRKIVIAVQHVLCEARNDWIIYFQGLISEGPDFEELAGDAQDFTVWIYPDKIMATTDNATVVRELIE